MNDRKDISSEASRILDEKSEGWRYHLFDQVLRNELDRHRDLRRRYELGVTIAPAEYLKLEETSDWIEAREAELEGYADALVRLIDETLQQAFDESHDSRAADQIVATAQTIAELYGRLLEWSQRVRGARAEEPEARSIFPTFAGITQQLVTEIEAYGPRVVEHFSRADTDLESTFDLFEFKYKDIQRYRRETAEYRRKTGCGGCGLRAAAFALAGLAAAACLA
jgi:hypothetical protein